MSEQVYADLFGDRDAAPPDTDHEFSRILRTHVFSDLFAMGELGHRTLDLNTVTAGLEPQVRSHIAGAKAAGNSDETNLAALAHLSGYVGFPAAVNAIRLVAASSA